MLTRGSLSMIAVIAGTRIGASASSLNAAISMLRRGSQGHDALELFEVIASTRIGARPS